MDFISLQLVQCEKNLVTQGYRTKSYDFILNLRERLSWCLPALLADEGKTQRDNPRANVLGSGPDQRRWHALKCNLALGWPRACDHANLSSSAWPHLVPERMCGRPPGAGKRTSLNWRAERARLASPHHFQMQRGPASQLPDGVTLWHLCNRSKRASRPFSSLVMPSSWLARWIMVLLLPKEAVPRSKTPLTLPDTDPSCFSVLVACTWAAAQSRGGHTARGHQSGERQSAWAVQCTETWNMNGAPVWHYLWGEWRALSSTVWSPCQEVSCPMDARREHKESMDSLKWQTIFNLETRQFRKSDDMSVKIIKVFLL